jgi:hypothetical protein
MARRQRAADGEPLDGDGLANDEDPPLWVRIRKGGRGLAPVAGGSPGSGPSGDLL